MFEQRPIRGRDVRMDMDHQEARFLKMLPSPGSNVRGGKPCEAPGRGRLPSDVAE
jgi:hypothetical protein